MTKAQLVTKLAESSGVSRKQIGDLLDALVETIVKSVKKGEAVKIPGLGIFRLRRMKARVGRNPQTGEEIKIPASVFRSPRRSNSRCSARRQSRR
jgi:DNA-binding protein HU-beta